MNFPNKVTSYSNSILPKFPILLEKIKEADISPRELYKLIKKHFKDISEFEEALSCLYALRKIVLTEKEVLHYVEKD
jgi:hypothetical protein